jgi:hypothetical protein
MDHKYRDARMARSGRDATLRIPCVPRGLRRTRRFQNKNIA